MASLQFYRNQQKISGMVKWNWHRCNFDQHLQTLRCDGLDLKSMKNELARELCKVYNTQINALINKLFVRLTISTLGVIVLHITEFGKT